MSRLVVSSGAEERLATALEWLRAEALRPEVLLLAANRGAADDLLRRAAAESGHLFAIHRATLVQAAYELAALPLAQAGTRPLSALARTALATRAVDAARSEDALGYFTPVADMPGFPFALSRSLTELRLQGIRPERLAAGDRTSRDLSALLERFESELARFELVDLAGVYAAATRSVEEGGHRYVGLPLLLLDVTPETLAEEALLQALARRAPSCLALVAAGEAGAAARIERALGVGAETLTANDADARPPGAGEVPLSALGRARLHLFSTDMPPSSKADDADDVELFSAPGEDRECVEIVRRIQSRAAAGVAFDQMAILLRQPGSYLPLLEDALRRGGVPAFFSRGTSRPDPAGRAFLALLACAAEGLSASRFAEYLSLGEAPDPDPSGAPPPVEEVPWVETASDEQLVFKSLVPAPGASTPIEPGQTLPVPAAWERMLVDAAVIGGRDRWRRRLDGLREELLLRLRHAKDEELVETEYLRSQIGRLDSLARFALPIVDALATLPDAAAWGEWLVALGRLATLVLRDADRVLRLLAELRPMADVGPVSLEQVYSVLADRLSFLQSEPPARRYGRVLVGTLSDARGRSFDTVFLPGLSEGIFPRKPFEDPLLLDVERRALDPGLAVQEDRFAAERALLRLALGAARERLVASYPRIDQRLGRARVPSFYALDLLRAAYGELPDLQALERAAGETAVGWPAPADPAAAIDDCEFDLAMLAPLLQPGGPALDRGGEATADVRGRARYLVHANEHLARSLRARWARWRPSWSKDDGLVTAASSTATLELLAAELPGARSYSPTALQTFAACPYRFLLHAIHRLRPREDRTSPEQLDPMTRGSLFHETQFAFFGEVRARSLLPLHRDFESELLDIADRALAGVAGRYEEDLAPAIPRIWRSEIETLRSDLRGWIRKLLEADGGFAPSHFEFAFGLDEVDGRKRDPASTAEPAIAAGGRKLRGSIDLVERDWRRRTLRVTDHKTGRAPSEKGIVIGGGELLQPVLYALAAEALIAGDDEQVESGRLFYCTQRGGYLEVAVPLDERSRAAAGQVLDAVEDALRRGFLPAAPREGACDWCDYRAVCGPYEELRVKKKKQADLETLAALRRHP